MVQLIKINPLEFPDNALIGKAADGLYNALTDMRKFSQKDRDQDIEQQKADQQGQLVKAQVQTADDAHQQNQVKLAGGVAQMIDNEQDPTARQGLWNTWIQSQPHYADALKRNGQDPTDFVNGPKFIMAQARGYKDPQADALQAAQIGVAQSHANYYDAAAKAVGQRGDAAQTNAVTRRLKAYGDIGATLGPNPTREQWEQENAPGGLVYAAFGGPQPYEKAPSLIQLAQARSNYSPEDERARAAGFSDEQIQDMARQRVMTEQYGPAKRGYKWSVTKEGVVTQEPAAMPVKPMSDSEKAMAVSALENFKRARDVLIDQQNAGQLWVADKTNGWINSTGYNALKDAEAAATDLSYFLSGKQIGNAEQLRLIRQYVPQPGDPYEVRKNKMERGERFFRNLMNARLKGIDTMDVIREALGESEKEGGGRTSGRTYQQGPANGAEKMPDRLRNLYDKYGLQ